MPKLTFLKNKKSSVEAALVHLLEIILAIAVVIVLIIFTLELTGFFIGRQDYDSTMNNFDRLVNSVTTLVGETNTLSIGTTSYSITDDYILVGFSYDDNGIMKKECPNENVKNSRPKSCQSKSCLCIYKNFGGVTDWTGADFDSKENVGTLRCKAFDEKIIFLAPPIDANFKGTETQWKPSHYQWPSYNYLVLYGICGGPWGASWGVRVLYLEKYKEGDNIFIFMGDMTNQEIIKRKDALAKNKNDNAEKKIKINKEASGAGSSSNAAPVNAPPPAICPGGSASC